MRLEESAPQALLTGIIPGSVVQVVACGAIGQDAVNLVFKGAEGRLQERMLFRSNEAHIAIPVEGRFEISYVPQVILQRDRVIGARAPVVEKYSHVCFEKQHVRPPGRPPAALIAPGHALMDTTVDLVLERYRPLLKQGAVFVNPKDLGTTPRMLFIIDHSVRDGGTDIQGRDRVISRKLQFVLLDAQGNATTAGPAPYLDYELLPAEAAGLRDRLLAEPWLRRDLEQQAMAYAATHLVPDHFAEVRERRLKLVDATLRAVHERLTVEINYWTRRYQQLLTEAEAGRQPRMQPENARRTAETLSTRLEKRTKDLEAQRNVMSSPPVIVGGALVIPQGLLDHALGRPAPDDAVDAAARAETERRGMETVMQHERRLGFTPRDVSGEDCGWDVTSTDAQGNCRFIEVKARRKDAATVTVSKNEMLVGFNKRGEGWYLALVFVDGETVDGPHYIAAPFDRKPGWAETSVNLSIAELLARGKSITT
jgi:hypothetical protein